jgi:pimeloyl-ACP methyl ester carboxylesterase
MQAPSCAITALRHATYVGTTRLSWLEWPASGSTCVLLHGVTSSAATLWRAAPALQQRGLRVLALDMPGHGLSDATSEHHIDAIATLVADWITVCDLHDVTLIGHSWGGSTAMALASGTHPARERLARVALLDPALAMSVEWGAEVVDVYTEGVAEPQEVNRPRLLAANPDWHACDVHWKAIALEQCRLEQARGLFIGGTWRLSLRAGRVDVPLLILLAEHDGVVSPELHDELVVHLPAHGRISVVPHTNHNMLRGGFSQTMQALEYWLHTET